MVPCLFYYFQFLSVLFIDIYALSNSSTSVLLHSSTGFRNNTTENQEPPFTQEVQTNLFKKLQLQEDILTV